MLTSDAHEPFSHYSFFFFFLQSHLVMYIYIDVSTIDVSTHMLIYTLAHTWLHLSSLPPTICFMWNKLFRLRETESADKQDV